MRFLLTSLCLLFIMNVSTTLMAQEDKAETLTVVEQMPEFQGGINELLMFIGENLNYPKKAQKRDIEGLVVISFIVRKSGELSDIKIIKDIGKGCGKEAARVVALTSGKWSPGLQKGKPVNVQYNLPVKFQLTD